MVVTPNTAPFPPSGLLASPPGRLANGLLDGLLADGVVAIGPSREILRASGIPDRRIHVLFNGVPPPARAHPGTAGGQSGPVRLLAGGLRPGASWPGWRSTRATATILEAVRQLVDQGRPVRLLVAGEGSYLDQVRQQAGTLPPGTVVLAGFVREVEQALWAMDVQINASYESETSSLSLLEGMSIGLPAVVSNCGGNPLLIHDGENGLVFPARDSGALAGRVARLMDRPEELAQMRRRAREIFAAQFTGEIFAKNVEQIYLDILKGAK